jgi:hypothetical protein
MAGTITGETKVIFLIKASFCNFDYLDEHKCMNLRIFFFFKTIMVLKNHKVHLEIKETL